MPFKYTYRGDTAWGPTLLLYGDQQDARALETALRAADVMEWLDVVTGHLSPATGQEPALTVELVEDESSPAVGLCQVTETALRWRTTRSGLMDLREKLASFLVGESGHHYLDEAGDIFVLLSVGEGHSA